MHKTVFMHLFYIFAVKSKISWIGLLIFLQHKTA